MVLMIETKSFFDFLKYYTRIHLARAIHFLVVMKIAPSIFAIFFFHTTNEDLFFTRKRG